MGAAMSVDVGTNNASRLLGPTLGGAILAGAGIGGAFWAGVALYAAALVAALALRARAPPRPPSGDGGPRPGDDDPQPDDPLPPDIGAMDTGLALELLRRRDSPGPGRARAGA